MKKNRVVQCGNVAIDISNRQVLNLLITLHKFDKEVGYKILSFFFFNISVAKKVSANNIVANGRISCSVCSWENEHVTRF